MIMMKSFILPFNLLAIAQTPSLHFSWLLNSSKFHQKVRRKRSEKKVRVLFLKSTSSTIKQPTSKLKIIVVKFVKKYVTGLLAQLAKAPVL